MKTRDINRHRRLNSLFGSGREYRPKPPEHKIEKAQAVVDKVLDKKMGFAYGQVKRIPLDTGREVRADIHKLEEERSSVLLHKDSTELARIRERISELRDVEKTHYHYAEHDRAELFKNFQKIKASCDLLVKEGILEYYHINKDGMLRMRHATAHDRLDVEEIPLLRVPMTRKEAHDLILIERNNRAYEVHPSKVHVADLELPHHGVKPYVEEKVTKGAGEYDPDILFKRGKEFNRMSRDDTYDYFKNLTFALYEEAEMRKMRDMNTVDCYA
jgi:hypothetical protein